MIRALSIDLRRSAAAGAGLIVLLLSLAAMYLIFGTDAWTGRWTPMASTLRSALGFTWPLTLAAGAWLVDRDRRGRVGELFATSARPRWQRAASPAVALSLTISAAYLLTVAACLPLVAGSSTYFNPAVIAVIATGLLQLIAAALLGMGLGTVMPSRFTAPALAIAGLVIASAPGLLSSYGAGRVQQRVALLSPVLGQYGDFIIVPLRLSAAQAIWAVAIVATGYLLLSGTNRRARAAAVVPTLAGAMLALTLLPSTGPASSVDAADPGARELICADGTPRVCVRRVHANLLPQVVAPARDALQRLSQLPNPPVAVEEAVPVIGDGSDEQYVPSAQTARFSLEFGMLPAVSAEQLERELLTGAGVTFCGEASNGAQVDGARLAAAYWLLGTRPPATDTKVVEAWQTLTALPPQEQKARISALREAGLACDNDKLWDILSGGPR